MVRIGLVLSGGGARGFAEIGALKVLKKNNVQFSSIAGCSIGALIGACYAFNEDPDAIEKLMLKVKNKGDVYDYAFSTKGLIKGQRIEKYIHEFLGSDGKKPIKFEDLKTPLLVNVTDIVNQKELIIDKGPLVQAVIASMSYPGFFTTRTIDGKICVDGGVVNPLPFDLIQHNVDYIIMIDVSKESVKITEDSNFKDIVVQSTLAMQRVIVDKSLETCSRPYTLIQPEVEYHGILEFDDLQELTKKGEEEAEKKIAKILQDISELEKKEPKVMKI
jgi:NTE family protein